MSPSHMRTIGHRFRSAAASCINENTRIHGVWFDLLIALEDWYKVITVTAEPPLPSDHERPTFPTLFVHVSKTPQSNTGIL